MASGHFFFHPDAIFSPGNNHFEPCPMSRDTCFPDANLRDRKDLPDQIQAKTGVLEIFPLEDLLFGFRGNSNPVIFINKKKSFFLLQVKKTDHGQVSAMTLAVFNQVVKYLLNERIGKYPEIIQG